jgi:hypothetical protein
VMVCNLQSDDGDGDGHGKAADFLNIGEGDAGGGDVGLF